MKTPDHDPLDTLFRDAAGDSRRDEWMRDAARGMEGRVLRRIARPETWAEAVFSLTSWRPLAAALFLVLIIGAWTGRGVADVFNDDWLTVHASAEPGEPSEDFDF
jgi:hypothetical protein